MYILTPFRIVEKMRYILDDEVKNVSNSKKSFSLCKKRLKLLKKMLEVMSIVKL